MAFCFDIGGAALQLVLVVAECEEQCRSPDSAGNKGVLSPQLHPQNKSQQKKQNLGLK